jgi:phage FluMu protein Com
MTSQSEVEFLDIRCKKDNALLFRARRDTTGEIEVWCKKCKSNRLIKLPVAGKSQSKYDERDYIEARQRP